MKIKNGEEVAQMVDVLYHYTNIDSLAMILKYKTLRLNSLDKMDDLEENTTADIKNAGMFTYVSSWTDLDVESIALWNQYTNHDTGVRIAMPIIPFKKYSIQDMHLDKTSMTILNEDKDIKSIIHLGKMFKSNYFTQVISGEDILHKVEYTDEENKINPQLVSIDSIKGTISIALGKVGKCKRSAWEYQSEWRYIIQFLPGNILSVLNDGGIFFSQVCADIVNGVAKQPFPYYDLELDDNAISKMKITLSPTISPGNEILIKNTIHRYNPNALVVESKLKGKIR